jgi:hypothetical protein
MTISEKPVGAPGPLSAPNVANYDEPKRNTVHAFLFLEEPNFLRG